MEWYEAAFDRMYPLVYPHRDLTEARKVVDSFAEIFRDRSPILDLACGNGRYVECLRGLGHEIFGLDLSHYLLRMGVEEWGHEGTLVQGDMRHLPFRDGSFACVINMFTSFGYFSRDTDNILVLREVGRVLEPGGIFLLDFINAGRLSPELLRDSVREERGLRVKERRRMEKGGKYLVKEVEIVDLADGTTSRIQERLRLYSRAQLESTLKTLGFGILAVYGDYDRNPFVEGVSERVIILAENRPGNSGAEE